MNIIQKINVCALLSLSVLSAKAQTTYMEMEQLTVNDQVTTVITASEPIRFVDISTDKVVGDQPINNIIRLKPKDNVYADGEVLAIVTIVTERYRTQYALLCHPARWGCGRRGSWHWVPEGSRGRPGSMGIWKDGCLHRRSSRF